MICKIISIGLERWSFYRITRRTRDGTETVYACCPRAALLVLIIPTLCMSITTFSVVASIRVVRFVCNIKSPDFPVFGIVLRSSGFTTESSLLDVTSWYGSDELTYLCARRSKRAHTYRGIFNYACPGLVVRTRLKKKKKYFPNVPVIDIVCAYRTECVIMNI